MSGSGGEVIGSAVARWRVRFKLLTQHLSGPRRLLDIPLETSAPNPQVRQPPLLLDLGYPQLDAVD